MKYLVKVIASFFLFFIGSYPSSHAQRNYKTKRLAISDSSAKSIKATVIKFPNRIFKAEYIPGRETVAFTIAEYFDKLPQRPYRFNSVALADLKMEKIFWHHGISGCNNFFMKNLFVFENGFSQVYSYDGIKKLNEPKGEYIWTYDLPATSFNANIKIDSSLYGIGITDRGDICNLETGNPIVENKIRIGGDLRDVKVIGDSLIFFASHSLTRINLHNRKLDTYNGQSVFVSPGQTALNIFIAIITLLRAQNLADNHYYHISSNICMIDSIIYYASGENILCIGTDGKILWQHDINPDNTSSSILFPHNGKLIQIETGRASVTGGFAKRGPININAIDLDTGDFTQTLNLDRPYDIVLDYQIKDSLLFLLTKKRMLTINLNTLSMSNSYSLEQKSVNATIAFLPERMMIFGTTTHLYRKYGDNNMILAYEAFRKNYLAFSSNGTFEELIPAEKLFRICYESDKLTIISNNKYSEVINTNGNVLFHLPYEGFWTDAGSHLILNSNKKAILFKKTELENLIQK